MAWENFPYLYTSPHIHSLILEALQVIIFWVRVTHKMLNVNWEKIHSIILSVTCHGLRNFAPAHIHPLKTIHEFSKPYELLFSELVTHKMQPQNKGPGMLWGQSYVLPMTLGGWRHWGPLSVDMRPYGCFI